MKSLESITVESANALIRKVGPLRYEDSTYGRHMFLTAVLPLYTGIRMGELRGLSGIDIFEENNLCWVSINEACNDQNEITGTKSGNRIVPIPYGLFIDLISFVKVRPCSAEVLFYNGESPSTPVTAYTISSWLKKNTNENITIPDLRKFFCSLIRSTDLSSKTQNMIISGEPPRSFDQKSYTNNPEMLTAIKRIESVLPYPGDKYR